MQSLGRENEEDGISFKIIILFPFPLPRYHHIYLTICMIMLMVRYLSKLRFCWLFLISVWIGITVQGENNDAELFCPVSAKITGIPKNLSHIDLLVDDILVYICRTADHRTV